MAIEVTHNQVCPDCGRTTGEGGYVDIENEFASQIIRCECGAVYQEVYEYRYTILLHHGSEVTADERA